MPEDPPDTLGKRRRRREQADHQVRLSRKVEEVTWMCQDAARVQQLQDEFFFGCERRNLNDAVPAPFGVEHAARRRRARSLSKYVVIGGDPGGNLIAHTAAAPEQ